MHFLFLFVYSWPELRLTGNAETRVFFQPGRIFLLASFIAPWWGIFFYNSECANRLFRRFLPALQTT
jgi:hypothetical protein